jgi:hypothetical protein
VGLGVLPLNKVEEGGVTVYTNPPAEEAIKTDDGDDVCWLQSDEKEEGDTGDRKWRWVGRKVQGAVMKVRWWFLQVGRREAKGGLVTS